MMGLPAIRFPMQNARPIVTAVGRRLQPKHGEPRLHQLVIGKGNEMTTKTAVIDPGAYDMPIPWPLSAENPHAEEVCLREAA